MRLCRSTNCPRKSSSQRRAKLKTRRRTPAERFKLTNFQVRLLAERYQAARNKNERLDYSIVARSTHFRQAFAEHPKELAAHAPWLLQQMEAAYKEEYSRQEAAQQQNSAQNPSVLDQLKPWLADELKSVLQHEQERTEQLLASLLKERERNRAVGEPDAKLSQ